MVKIKNHLVSKLLPVKISLRIFFSFMSLLIITASLFLWQAKIEGQGKRFYLFSNSNLLTPVHLHSVAAKNDDWSTMDEIALFEELSKKVPIDFNTPFPNQTSLKIHRFAIPLSVPLAVRNCARQNKLDLGLFAIQKSRDSYMFANQYTKQQIEITPILNRQKCRVGKKFTLIQTNDGILRLQKVISIDQSIGPIHFASYNSDFIVVSRTGDIQLVSKTGLIKREGRLFDEKEFSNTNFAHLGVKSVIMLKDYAFVAAAVASKNCAFISVRKIQLNLVFANEEIFRSICIKDDRQINSKYWTDMNGSGGRLFATAPSSRTLFLSVGQAEIWQGSEPVAVNPKLGVLLTLSLTDGKQEVISQGHRNIQGICSVNGQTLVSEQGPQGGDELNWITKNGNYGWPHVSYGRPYGVNTQFPSDREFGTHNMSSYIGPTFSWVPSVAIGDLACPLTTQGSNEYWILGATLKDQSIHKVLFNNKHVIYDERIFLGERIRDLKFDFKTNLGFLATDSGKIFSIKYVSF